MEKIKKLRKLIKKFNIDGYLVPKNDEYFLEYLKVDRDRLRFITNFTGSFGFSIILQKKNYLFVDGRYSQQAERESGKNFKIVTIPKKMPHQILKKKLRLGYDPKLFNENKLNMFLSKTESKLVSIQDNLIDLINTKKINNTKKEKIFFLDKKQAGETQLSKMSKIKEKLKKDKFDFILITAPENLCWLLNLRGSGSEFSPIANGYLIINNSGKSYLFLKDTGQKRLIEKKVKGISVLEVEKIHEFLRKVRNKKIRIDSHTCSIFFKRLINSKNKVVEKTDYTYYLKAQKNKTEIMNFRKSHIYDGAALTKFIIWVKKNFNKKRLTEISAEKKLLAFRKKNKCFFSSSFPSISASGPNGSIIHYRANKLTNRKLKNGDIYLIDSGGQYKFGTTDVTRTISLNNSSKNIKRIFTKVLQGHIAVDTFNLREKTTGDEIDRVARKPLNSVKLDYPHGTGHGVGYFLNVHEGPQAITKKNHVKLKEGMVLSNEPGYYLNKKFGIRIENLISVRRNKSKLEFETLTLAPIDKDLIDKKNLKQKEINWINDYHKKVFKKLRKFIDKSEMDTFRLLCSNL